MLSPWLFYLKPCPFMMHNLDFLCYCFTFCHVCVAKTSRTDNYVIVQIASPPPMTLFSVDWINLCVDTWQSPPSCIIKQTGLDWSRLGVSFRLSPELSHSEFELWELAVSSRRGILSDVMAQYFWPEHRVTFRWHCNRIQRDGAPLESIFSQRLWD